MKTGWMTFEKAISVFIRRFFKGSWNIRAILAIQNRFFTSELCCFWFLLGAATMCSYLYRYDSFRLVRYPAKKKKSKYSSTPLFEHITMYKRPKGWGFHTHSEKTFTNKQLLIKMFFFYFYVYTLKYKKKRLK